MRERGKIMDFMIMTIFWTVAAANIAALGLLIYGMIKGEV